jgi:hypothetical protein
VRIVADVSCTVGIGLRYPGRHTSLLARSGSVERSPRPDTCGLAGRHEIDELVIEVVDEGSVNAEVGATTFADLVAVGCIIDEACLEFPPGRRAQLG